MQVFYWYYLEHQNNVSVSLSVIVLTHKNHGRGQVALVSKPKIVSCLVVLMLEIGIILIMVCGEFVQAKGRTIYLGLFQQHQRRQNSKIFIFLQLLLLVQLSPALEGEVGERLNAEPNKKLHRPLAQ